MCMAAQNLAPYALAVVMFMLPLLAYAQLSPAALNTFFIEITPEYPEPNTTITARAVGNGLELARSTIAWTVNGDPVASGVGHTAITTSTGKIGSRTSVEALAVGPDRSSSRATAVVHPTEVDLVWSANSYTPPFFRGRALPSAGTTIAIEAITRFHRENGTPIDSDELVYTWKVNSRVLGNVSGRGKRTATIPAPPLFGTNIVSATIESLDGVYTGKASVRIPSSEPVLELYHDHPLFGVLYNTTIGTNSLFQDVEATFAVIPYYTDTAQSDRDLTYSWFVNGNAVPESTDDASRITIRTSGSAGIALIELALGHASNWLQNASRTWNITFEEAPRGGLFNEE